MHIIFTVFRGLKNVTFLYNSNSEGLEAAR